MNINEIIGTHLLELLVGCVGILISVIIRLGTNSLSNSINFVSSRVTELSSEMTGIKNALDTHSESQSNYHMIIERRVSSLESSISFSNSHSHDSNGNVIYRRRSTDNIQVPSLEKSE